MKRFAHIALFLTASFLVFALCPRGAYSETVQLTFIGPEGASSGGQYIYPYDFNIQNGSTTETNVKLMCISLLNHIENGESWIADVFTASSLGTDYEEAAYLFHVASTSGDPATVADAQWAAWGLFDPSSPGNGDDLSLLVAQAIANAGSYGNYLVYVPQDDTQTGNLGTPQMFVGPPAPTPEPGSLLLLGTAVLGLLSAIYFRKRPVQGIIGNPCA